MTGAASPTSAASNAADVTLAIRILPSFSKWIG